MHQWRKNGEDLNPYIKHHSFTDELEENMHDRATNNVWQILGSNITKACRKVYWGNFGDLAGLKLFFSPI
jgi:tRNA(Ile)-lysidine synthase TilS/MesJ